LFTRPRLAKDLRLATLLHSPLALLIGQLVVIIAVARLLGALARRVHQPQVVAEMLAGILLGPSLLGLLAPAAQAALFPRSSLDVLGLVSQLGLILFMFLVGLEMDLGLLRGRGAASVAISHAGILVPFALGAALARAIHPTLAAPAVPLTSFTLFLGAAMSVTAFSVLARILSERRLLRTRVGAVALTCAAVDDVTAWCILAFVGAAVRPTAVGDAVWTTALAVLYTLAMLFAVRPFLARLAARGGDGDGPTQDVVAVTFVLLLLSSGVTEVIGVHALFGAFLMGAIVPRHAGFARALAEKLEDPVVIVLLPAFFALSGLRTEIGLLDSPAEWLQCGLIVLVACLGKFGGCFVAARWTGLGWREAGALGVLMNTRGMMELIVLNIGLDLGIFTPTLFTMMVLMALFTTLVATPVLQLVYPSERLADDLLARPQPPPTPAAGGLRVLMCVATARDGPAMATVARALAGPAASIHALQLLRPAERTSHVLADADADAADAIAPLLAHGERHGLAIRPLSFVSSEPARDICSVAEVKAVDLVLLGRHRPLLGRSPLGGTVHEVLAAAPADVGVLIDRGLGEVRRVLVAYHGSDHDRAALALAARTARTGEVRVTVLRLGPADDILPADTDLAVIAGSPAEDPGDQLVAAAPAHDLVILGLGFGRQPEQVLTRCPTSVLVIRARAAAAAVVPPASAE
jgi:Kef-type K+ transport system membrane component KefB/nucleotide-binding universal stress UspA family protein